MSQSLPELEGLVAAPSHPARPLSRKVAAALLFVVALFAVMLVAYHSVPGHPQGALLSNPSDSHRAYKAGPLSWDNEAKLAPWLTSIEEGSSKGVGIVLGQSLKPDGNPSRILISRAKGDKQLLDDGKVEYLIVSGGDPAGVGSTEAFEMRKVLVKEGVPFEKVIMEPQAFTTSENAWFSLRWLPPGTGKFYIVTSEFHVARAYFTFQAVFNHFYKIVEEEYKDDPRWKSQNKKFPRLEIIPVPIPNFCGTDPTTAKDEVDTADITERSLAFRAAREVGLMIQDVDALYGEPKDKYAYNYHAVWATQINTTKDNPENEKNYKQSIAVALNVVKAVCKCTGSIEGEGPEADKYPLDLPGASKPGLPDGLTKMPKEFEGKDPDWIMKNWEGIILTKCGDDEQMIKEVDKSEEETQMQR